MGRRELIEKIGFDDIPCKWFCKISEDVGMSDAIVFKVICREFVKSEKQLEIFEGKEYLFATMTTMQINRCLDCVSMSKIKRAIDKLENLGYIHKKIKRFGHNSFGKTMIIAINTDKIAEIMET